MAAEPARAARTPGSSAETARRRVPACRSIGAALAAALPLFWCRLPVEAAEVGAAADSRPIAVTAQSGIEWQKQAQVYVARGNAVATRGATTVRADTLTAHYRPAKGTEGGEVYRLDADGHVTINNQADTVSGDQAAYDVGQEIAVVTGKHLKLTTTDDVVTARDSFEWYDTRQIAVARGDAVAVKGDRRIRADVLTAHMIKEKPPDAAPPAAAAKPASAAPAATPAGTPAEVANSKISRVDAQGNVVVSTPTDIARGKYGVYDALTGIVTLLGDVTITRGQSVIRGQYAVVDLNTNVSRMMSLPAEPGKPAQRVEGMFVRQDTAGGPPGSAAPPKKTGPAAKGP